MPTTPYEMYLFFHKELQAGRGVSFPDGFTGADSDIIAMKFAERDVGIQPKDEASFDAELAKTRVVARPKKRG
jgi:hypothetical protein